MRVIFYLLAGNFLACRYLFENLYLEQKVKKMLISENLVSKGLYVQRRSQGRSKLRRRIREAVNSVEFTLSLGRVGMHFT